MSFKLLGDSDCEALDLAFAELKGDRVNEFELLLLYAAQYYFATRVGLENYGCILVEVR